MRHFGKTILVTAIAALYGCGDKATFTSKGNAVTEDNRPAAAAGQKNTGEEETEKPEERASYNLQIITQRDLENPDPVQLVFVLDTSRSMADNLGEVQAAIPRFVDRLTPETPTEDQPTIPFTARIIPMQYYLAQLNTQNDNVYPYGMGPDGPANFQRQPIIRGVGEEVENSASWVNPYRSVELFTNENRASLDDKIGEMASVFQDSSTEPGLCAIVDYRWWLEARPEGDSAVDEAFGKQRIHHIVVTDEDDKTGPGSKNRGFEKHNPFTGQLEWSKPLLCRSEKTDEKECPKERYDELLTFNRYTYNYTMVADKTEHIHKIRFFKRTKCDQFADPNGVASNRYETYPLVNLYSRSKYHSYDYKCDQEVTKYDCSAGDYEASDLQSNDLTGQKRCQLNDAKCNVPDTNYDCTASPGYEGRWSTDEENVRRYCPVAQRFNCITYQDGQALPPSEFSRDDALALLKLYKDEGFSCTPIRNSAEWKLARISNSGGLDINDDGVYVDECNPLSCVEDTQPDWKNMTWSQADAYANGPNDNRCEKRDNPFISSRMPSTFNPLQRWGVDFCDDWSCDPVTVTEAYNTRVNKADVGGKYVNCGDEQIDDVRNTYSANTAGGKPAKFSGITKKAKPGTTFDLGDEFAEYSVSSTDFCESTLVGLGWDSIGTSQNPSYADPSDGNRVYSKRAKDNRGNDEIASNRWTTITIPIKNRRLTRPEIIQWVIDEYGDEAIADNPRWVEFVTIEDVDTPVETEHTEIYTYQRYPRDHSIWRAAKEISVEFDSFVDVIRDNSIEIPAPANRNAANPVLVKEYIHKNGRLERDNCDNQPELVTVKVAPEPKEIVSAMRKDFPDSKFTQHAIVMKNADCDGNENRGSELGSKYIELAKLTDGYVGDVCSSDYNGIMESIYEAIVNELVTKYPMPDKYKGFLPYRVYNKTKDRVMKPGADWWIDGDVIVFNPKSVAESDDLNIEW